MPLYTTSINRPVLATVMSLGIVLFGIISYRHLAIREYPAADPPIISVSTSYTGASAEVMESDITEPLEESINAVQGIQSLSSVSREGRSTIRVEFRLGIDMETAANDVRDRVSQAQGDLPPDAEPPSVIKADSDSDPVVFLNIYSPTRDLLELSDLADRRFKPIFQTIPGVSEVSIWGEKRYAMRIYLDRDRLAAYALTPSDVRTALDRENVQLPSGRLDAPTVEMSVKTSSRFASEEDFNNMVVRESAAGNIRLRDVGRASLGPAEMRTILKRDGIPMVGIVLRPQPGSNHIDISDEFHRRLEHVRKDLPDDIELGIGFDTSEYIRSSIAEVKQTILIAVVLVVLIIFLFLRDLRSTLIPLVVIPISLIGGFFLMDLAGFSINVLTLLAMVLAIGLVVDDAIVVLENIYSKIEAGLDAKEAAAEGTREIFFAVIATTLALCAVFLPIVFLGGLVGQLFREFGLVLGGTVIISSFVALTLTPMLCSKLLRRGSHSRFYHATEGFFTALTGAYRRVLSMFLRVRWLALPLLLASAALTWWFVSSLENELAPLEDRGRLRIIVSAPEGTAYDAMADYMDALNEKIADTVPESEAVISVTSPGFAASSSVNSGFVRLVLPDSDTRERSQQEIADALLAATMQMPFARVAVVQEPSISVGGGGRSLPLQFIIQAQNLEQLSGVLPEMMQKAMQTGVFSRVDVDLKFNKPEMQIEIDRERAQSLGVSALDVSDTLNLALSEQRYGYFLRDGKQYSVIGSLMRDQREDSLDLRSLTVPSRESGPIRLDSLVHFEESVTPPQLFRYNRSISATVSAAMQTGSTLGQGIEAMQGVAQEVLDETFQTAFGGEARDLQETGDSILFAFVLALLIVYLVLAAQFESFRDPIIILLTVPLALLGATGALVLFGQTLNIFSQIGIIMLIGLVTKNGILVVEFSNQRRVAGLSAMQAALEGAAERFRPILMTSLSTILGILPIAVAFGAGAESRRALGIAVIGGVTIGTLLTLLVIPAVYAALRTPNSERRRRD